MTTSGKLRPREIIVVTMVLERTLISHCIIITGGLDDTSKFPTPNAPREFQTCRPRWSDAAGTYGSAVRVLHLDEEPTPIRLGNRAALRVLLEMWPEHLTRDALGCPLHQKQHLGTAVSNERYVHNLL